MCIACIRVYLKQIMAMPVMAMFWRAIIAVPHQSRKLPKRHPSCLSGRKARVEEPIHRDACCPTQPYGGLQTCKRSTRHVRSDMFRKPSVLNMGRFD